MSNSIAGALGDFVSSLSAIATSLVQSIIALFQAFLALLQDVASSGLQLVQTFVKLGIDLFQGVAGFVMGEWGAFVCIPPFSSCSVADDDGGICSKLLCDRCTWRRVLFLYDEVSRTRRTEEPEGEEVGFRLLCRVRGLSVR